MAPKQKNGDHFLICFMCLALLGGLTRGGGGGVPPNLATVFKIWCARGCECKLRMLKIVLNLHNVQTQLLERFRA